MKPIAVDVPRPRRPLLEILPPPGTPQPPAHRYQDLTITEEWCGPALVIAVDGEVDLGTAPLLRHVLDAALTRAPRRVVVDLSCVRFLNTAGLVVLIDAHRRAGPGTDVRLVATTRSTWRPLQLTRAYERLAIHSSRTAALAAPRSPRC
ncbi:STAS domain-containing protein [Amycolatopsis sp. RTGN1]|uniref:STAS domain-containing protein n=1 Tax=Amycolatopsis ponsaeliensis TaxID=2992142 RepID=UPI00254BEB68|nr:STAS domain-containing protein [Amycolatopsis sp. RTGN1]